MRRGLLALSFDVRSLSIKFLMRTSCIQLRLVNSSTLRYGYVMSIDDELVSLFLAASKTVAQHLASLGIPLTLPRTQTSVSRDRQNPDSWQSRNYEVQQNTLAHQGSALYSVIPLLPPEVSAIALQCAQSLVAVPESKLPFWSPFEGRGRLLATGPQDPADYTSDAADWTLRHLLLSALHDHLVALPSLDNASVEAAEDFAQDVLRVVTADRLNYRITVPIAGLNLRAKSSSISLGRDILFRRLSEDEQGNVMQRWGIGSSISGQGAFTAVPLSCLQIDISTPRDRQNPDAREDIARWLCALQLCGYSVAGYFAVFETNPRWVAPISMNIPLTLPSQPRKWSNLSEAGARKTVDIASKLTRYHITVPASEHDLALHRFHVGLGRLSSVDSVLDFVIALEALLLPYDEAARHGDLGYRFRVHGAHYMGRTKNQREEVAKQLTGLYGLRSNLVHGNKYPTVADIEAGRLAAEDLSRRGLLRAIGEGFPTAVTFKKTILGV
jgi:hypothetical protein